MGSREGATSESSALLLGRRASSGSHAYLITAVYCVCMLINGGMIGAFGPSLESFQRATSLSAGQLGTAVLQNRLSKLGGTLLWAWYAGKLAQPHAPKPLLRPHAAMALGLAVVGGCCAVLGLTSSGLALQLVMAASGAAYGFTDSGCIMLSLWLWRDDPRRQRGCVALTSVFFTGGAFITPMLVAAALHYLSQTIWPAFHAIALVALLTALLLVRLPSPMPSRKPAAADEPKDSEGEAVALTHGDPRKAKSGRHRRHNDIERAEVKPASSGRGHGVDGHVLSELRITMVVASAGLIGFFANGCEHAVATWLSAYGVHQSGMKEEQMAILTSNYWTTMSAGRLAWAFCSGFVPSVIPPLVLNHALCFLGGLFYMNTSERSLYAATVCLGLGVSSVFPALLTLPPEANIEMTPNRMATLQLLASAGEMLCPFFVGMIFQVRLYSFFGPLIAIEQAISFLALGAAALLTRRAAATAAYARLSTLDDAVEG